jgi:hypothetical protein
VHDNTNRGLASPDAADGYHLVVAVAPAQCHRRIGSREGNRDNHRRDLKVRLPHLAYAPVASYARDGVEGGGQVHMGAWDGHILILCGEAQPASGARKVGQVLPLRFSYWNATHK